MVASEVVCVVASDAGSLRLPCSLRLPDSLLANGSILGSTSAAFATSYPNYLGDPSYLNDSSSDNVQNARQSETAKKAEIVLLNQLRATLQSVVNSAQADAVQKGAAAQGTQQRYNRAAAKAVTLKGQADDAKSRVDSPQ